MGAGTGRGWKSAWVKNGLITQIAGEGSKLMPRSEPLGGRRRTERRSPVHFPVALGHVFPDVENVVRDRR